MTEEWRDIKDFEGSYQISNFGNVRSLNRFVNNNGGQSLIQGQILRNFTNGSGYTQCKLSKEGIGYQPFVHKLVAQHFIDNPEDYDEVNHIDHNKENNFISNLEWCNRSQNMIKFHEFIGSYQEVFCSSCGKEITKGADLCVICLGLKNRIVERPSKEELSKLIRTTPFTKIGKMYGVSDNSIRKWCKSYGLPSTKAELTNAD